MGQKLFIGGLPFSTSTDELGQLFNQVPGVENVAIVTDRDTGQSRGFGFVEMSSSKEAQKAIESLNGTQLDGRTLTVNEAKPMERRDNRGGGGRDGGRNRW